jgi:hypothetical protein
MRGSALRIIRQPKPPAKSEGAENEAPYDYRGGCADAGPYLADADLRGVVRARIRPRRLLGNQSNQEEEAVTKKSYSIVGTNHTGKEAVLAALKGGEEVFLIREPLNPYDPLAVAVWIGGERIGYIPKKQNRTLAQFIDQTGATIAGFALDGALAPTPEKHITAKFVWSPNSHFPMVEV